MPYCSSCPNSLSQCLLCSNSLPFLLSNKTGCSLNCVDDIGTF